MHQSQLEYGADYEWGGQRVRVVRVVDDQWSRPCLMIDLEPGKKDFDFIDCDQDDPENFSELGPLWEDYLQANPQVQQEQEQAGQLADGFKQHILELRGDGAEVEVDYYGWKHWGEVSVRGDLALLTLLVNQWKEAQGCE